LNTSSTTLEFIQDFFVAGERAMKWPQAVLHTQVSLHLNPIAP
jgi:hypothetical protein